MTVVQAHQCPPGGEDPGPGTATCGWSPIERRIVLGEEGVDLVAEPALVPELEAMATEWQQRQQLGQPLAVRWKFGGSCQTTGPSFPASISGSMRS